MTRNRRDRLIRFVDYAGGNRPWFAVTIGRMTVSCAVLTDDALEDLAGTIRESFWRTRRLDSENRAAHAARRAQPTPFRQAAE